MTKEEHIWDEFMGEGDFDSLSIHNKSLIKGILSSYAKQQAIAFDKWKRLHLFTYNIDDETYVHLIIEGDNARTETVSCDDVYLKFIEQQNK